jgi:hypothetical protein
VPFLRALFISAGGFRKNPPVFLPVFILIENSNGLYWIIVVNSWFAGKHSPVITFYWRLQLFSFYLFEPATYAGDYYGWQIKKSVFKLQYVI